MPDRSKTDALAVAENAARKPRKNAKTGLYSWVNSKRLPKARSFQKTRRELAIYRDDLIREYGGEKISPQALALVDATCEAMAVVKILGCYTRQFGVIDSHAAKHGTLSLTPLLSKSWVSYQNLIRQNIAQLEELRKARARDNEDGMAEFRRYIGLEPSGKDGTYEAPEKPQDAPQDAPGGRTAGGQGSGQGEPS
ncbi:MAG: hypothetical protein ABFD52_05045 [Acidobacteriota bacterium]